MFWCAFDVSKINEILTHDISIASLVSDLHKIIKTKLFVYLSIGDV